ncbi:hypothetical protein PHISCL_06772, partial [Aspergillus sclerotialis]
MTAESAVETGTNPDGMTMDETIDHKPTIAETDTTRRSSGAKGNSQTSRASKLEKAAGSHSSPKKRRKVNHGKIHALLQGLWSQTQAALSRKRQVHVANPHLQHAYIVADRLLTEKFWLRGTAYDLRFGTTFLNFMQFGSERPCTRCIKRNIGHLCHDEPREPSRRSRGDRDHSVAEDEGSNNEFSTVHGMPRNVDAQDAAGQQLLPDGTIGLSTSVNPPVVQPGNISSSSQGLGANSQQLLGYSDWLAGQSQFQDMHTLHPSYMFNAPEVTNEYNLLGDFLSNSLLDDASMFQNDDLQGIYSDPNLINSMASLGGPSALMQQSNLAPPTQSQPGQGGSIQRPSSTAPANDKARETYYMTAADPSGSDPPEERMNKLLKAKYDAGLLKPFNYVKGYARLNQYMEKNMQQVSRQKILRQLDKFRPKFRERMQSLTDIELILVEMWFERSLMEYDRVFASMAIPACCWRRTGEIFRGNKEMAELIGVPIEKLRDGKLAIHEIIVEDQLVSYWEKFGAIAFDNTQKAMLTSCTLKPPESTSSADGIACCFSFTIRRDTHN